MDQVRVHVDRELCMSSGRCLADIPEAFAFDSDELAVVLPTAVTVAVERLRAAARTCPSQAITVEIGGQRLSSRQLALAAGTLPPGTPEVDVIYAGSAAGFAAVGLRPNEAGLTARDGEAARLAAALEGVQILDVEVIRIGLTSPLVTARIIDYAAAVGAAHVLVVSDAVSPGATIDGFGHICQRAQGSGLRPVLEFMRFTSVPDLATALRVVGSAGHPLGAVLVDALHLARSGGYAGDLEVLPASLVPYIQVCDAPADGPGDTAGLAEEARHARLLPGDGDLPLGKLVLATPGTPVSVEVQSDVGWRTRSVVQWAQDAFDSADRLVSRIDADA